MSFKQFVVVYLRIGVFVYFTFDALYLYICIFVHLCILHFYRTQVSLGSGLWVPVSVPTSNTFG